ncbi:hypothetical protein QWY82_01405 [Simiduia curdlanivorans]|uniref:Surface antigen domain-containing protein n=1 Tax=Simiduia curdlanivorans TaxID=1492769 RepID=A0ABV8V3W9_9GAMM|nr:hypothetical protein [Simiduia curdlanivorans]MDN3637452.1 hypothetical protein [Simiduia curdlanivorans]
MAPQQLTNSLRLVLAASLFCLAFALAYFAWQVRQVVTAVQLLEPYLPALLEESERWRGEVNKSVTLAETEVPKVLASWQSTQTYLNESTPATLEEVAAMRQSLDKQLPLVLAQVQALDAQLPKVLAEVAAVRAAIPAVLDSIPPVLAESQALRQEVPLMLTQAENLVDKAGVAGKKASEGAIKGMFSGVLKMPFDLLLGASELLIGGEKLTDADIAAITQTADSVLARRQLGLAESYQVKTGLSGTVTLESWFQENNQQCAKLSVFGERKNKNGNRILFSACPDGKQGWHYQLL